MGVVWWRQGLPRRVFFRMDVGATRQRFSVGHASCHSRIFLLPMAWFAMARSSQSLAHMSHAGGARSQWQVRKASCPLASKQTSRVSIMSWKVAPLRYELRTQQRRNEGTSCHRASGSSSAESSSEPLGSASKSVSSGTSGCSTLWYSAASLTHACAHVCAPVHATQQAELLRPAERAAGRWPRAATAPPRARRARTTLQGRTHVERCLRTARWRPQQRRALQLLRGRTARAR